MVAWNLLVMSGKAIFGDTLFFGWGPSVICQQQEQESVEAPVIPILRYHMMGPRNQQFNNLCSVMVLLIFHQLELNLFGSLAVTQL